MFIDELKSGSKIKILVKVKGKTLEFEVTKIELDIKSKDAHYICTTPVVIDDKPVSFKSEAVKVLGLQSLVESQMIQWSMGFDIRLMTYQGTLCYYIPCTSNVKPINRRSAYRVSIMLDGMMKLQRQGNNYNTAAIITDMSIFGLGLSVPVKTDVEERDMLIVTFQDEAMNKNFSIRCVVVRVEEIPGSSMKKVGCRMAVESAQISAYLSEKQRRILERDKGFYRKNVNEK